LKIVKERPDEYNAIQFDKEFVQQYGLIKYPMLSVRKHALYPAKSDMLIGVYPKSLHVIASVWTRINGRPLVRYIDTLHGQALIDDSDDYKLVKVPWDKTKTDWEKHHFLFIPYERKVTRPVYDFDSPELDEFEYRYYLGDTQVNDKDWIVTDSEGKSEVFSPDEFDQNFVRKSGVQDEQEETQTKTDA
jgi:hypothetical protein